MRSTAFLRTNLRSNLRSRLRRYGSNVLAYGLLLFICLIILVPVYFMFITSVKTSQEIFAIPIKWLPEQFMWKNYIAIFQKHPFARYFLNSVFVAGVTAGANLFFSSMAGYGLAKFKFKGRHVILSFVLVTLLLPRQGIVVPLYLIMQSIKLVDNLWAVILPFAATSFGVFLMRQYLVSIPDSLLESPRIDGAGEFRIYWNIVVPLIVPAFAALGIFSFTFNWNNFLWPLIILKTQLNYTMPLGIAMMQGVYETAYNELLAAAMFSSVPILVVYFILQKRFINSMVMSGIKE
jgi:ABC-type glycerol-3-phosphate transport system permease component